MHRRTFTLMEFPAEVGRYDYLALEEYGPNDPEYDWGFAEDGWRNPPPCPVCRTPYGACRPEDFYERLD